ncbi:MAG TPA: hypothetical protein VJ718_03025 [Candidatus Binataceae bacterium]|nr:hypothetical protein [Candidatus Binataceae bacterium]
MSSQDITGDRVGEDEIARDADRDNDSVASKLSKELSNWRRRRTNGRPRRNETSSGGFQSESARTIKVRGHETLVIRKPKIAGKPRVNERSGQ